MNVVSESVGGLGGMHVYYLSGLECVRPPKKAGAPPIAKSEGTCGNTTVR